MSKRVAEIAVLGERRLFLTSFSGGADIKPRAFLQISMWGLEPVQSVQLNRAQVERLERELSAWLAGETDPA